MHTPFVNIRIDIPDGVERGYDPTLILDEFIRNFKKDEKARSDAYVLNMEIETSEFTFDCGRLQLSTNCQLAPCKISESSQVRFDSQ